MPLALHKQVVIQAPQVCVLHIFRFQKYHQKCQTDLSLVSAKLICPWLQQTQL